MLAIDIIGDIHGQLAALVHLGRRLGYAVDGDWRHPEGRRLVFVGDLIDRGPHGLEVAATVRRLCADADALCLLGNHEYNLVEWRHGRSGPKSSNRDTIEAIEADPDRWSPLLDFFESLPIALELEHLRVTHAAWHGEAFRQLAPVLSTPSPSFSPPPAWAGAIALHAVYASGRHRDGLPEEDMPGQTDGPLEVFLKGYESEVQVPFRDNDGALRRYARTQWWKSEHREVPRDKRIVFGHYWNMPPVSGVHDAFVPPYPSGHPDLRSWFEAHHARVPDEGSTPVPARTLAVCIDYNGVTRAGARACVGAYRHPEAEVAWATAPLG